MTATYMAPRQSRAQLTEKSFLHALQELLKKKSFALVTIDEIAENAGRTRSAFLKRFGNKNQALLLLYETHCCKARIAIAEMSSNLHSCADAQEACYRISRRAEELQIADFAANRAINELFSELLAPDPQTQRLFLAWCDLMKQIQARWLPPGSATEKGVRAAAQLLLTINHNHVLNAMPGLPEDRIERHRMIATLVSQALRY